MLLWVSVFRTVSESQHTDFLQWVSFLSVQYVYRRPFFSILCIGFSSVLKNDICPGLVNEKVILLARVINPEKGMGLKLGQ